MSKSYNCLPTDLWTSYDPRTPRGFYLNRGVYYFGQKIEKELNDAEAEARKNHKSAQPAAQQRMVNAARLRVIEKNLGIPIKRNRDIGKAVFAPSNRITDKEGDKDETIVVKSGF